MNFAQLKAQLWEHRLVKSVSVLLVGNVAGNAINLLAQIYLGRSLDKAQYGVFTSIQAGVMLLSSLADFGLSTAAVKFHNELVEEKKEDAARVLLTRLLGIRLALILTLGFIVLLAHRPLAQRFFDQAVPVSVLWWMCVGAVAMSLWAFAQTLLQIQHRFSLYSGLTFANHLMRLLLILACVAWVAQPLYGAIVIFALLPFGGALLGFASARAKLVSPAAALRPQAELGGAFSRIISFSRWVFITTIINSFIMRLDVLQLTGLSTSAEVGRYGMANNLAQGVLMVTATISTVLLPRMATIRDRARMLRFYKMQLLGLGGLVVLVPLGLLLNHLLTPWVVGPKYATCVPILDLLIIAHSASLVCNPLSFFCYAFGRTHYITLCCLIQLVILSVGNSLIIPKYGAYGPAVMLIIINWTAYVLTNIFFFRMLKDATVDQEGIA